MKLPMLILTGAMFIPTALKTFWPQTSEDIPHFSSHTFLRTEISEEERLSLRLRPMEQRAALSMCTRSANRSAPLLVTRSAGSGLFALRRKRHAQKNQKLNAKVSRLTQQQAAAFTVTARSFPANARGTRRLEQNEWLVSILLFFNSTKNTLQYALDVYHSLLTNISHWSF